VSVGQGAEEEQPTSRRSWLRRRRQNRRHRRLKLALLISLVVVLALGGSVAGYVEFLNHQIHRVHVKDLAKPATHGPEQGEQNILLVGSTTRCGLTQQNPVFGLCSQGVNGVNSDVIMVLHLDPAKKQAAVISIPRDLVVPNARATGFNKIDAALYEGPNQLVDAIEEDFGIPIQHYVELNFDSFMGIVNALGGVKMYFPMPVYDAYSQLNIQTAGCQDLNGFEALALVRSRHLQYKPPSVTTDDTAFWPYDPESDLSRIVRDHEFLRVLASTVAKRGLGNPFTDRSLLAAVTPYLQVDTGLSLTSMVQLLLDFHTANPFDAPELTIPVQISTSDSYSFNGYNFGSVEFTSEPQDTQAIDKVMGVGPNTDTMTGDPLPGPGSITVAVQNGTGAYNQASQTASALQSLGYQVVSATDAASQNPVAETFVEYSSKSEEGAAEQVSHSLSGAVVMALEPTNDGAAVTVVTGSDYSVNTPPSSSSSSPTSSSSTSTSTTTAPSSTSSSSSSSSTPVSASSGTLTPPTSDNPGLAPFDPRPCTPSGGEG
jgi:LCP family protein required for cell wall assembly